MLIRNVKLTGHPGPTDLRLMHGRVQEIGTGLAKGLYESELDLAGDELRPCPPDRIPPRSMQRRQKQAAQTGDHIVPGTPSPLTRWRGDVMISWIDEHSAD